MDSLVIGDRLLCRCDMDISLHDRYNLVLSGNKFYNIIGVDNYSIFQVIFIYDDNERLFSFVSNNYISGNYIWDYFYIKSEVRLRKLYRLMCLWYIKIDI